MSDRLSFDRDGADWPLREASRFVEASELTWHVQRMGRGPTCLLLHGTGGATHSWRDVAPLLAQHFDVVAPDLPGHGFTQALPSRRLTLPGMAGAVADLLDTLGVAPSVVVGHSAGAAILARLCLDGRATPDALVSFNGALRAFRGLAQQFYAPLAKLLALNPFVPRLLAHGAASRASVERLIRQTGSTIDSRGLDLYARLFGNPGHVAGTLGMMAGWDLPALERDLPRLATRLVLVACSDDGAVPATDAFALRDAVPGAEVVYLRHLGHLMHEERPAEAAGIVLKAAGMTPG
ncbi:MAG: alpha/beta fold hydrolase [Proteobacteria bacterium]|nr:alpha/beta fold hydrolase [Pseudomonadota bacterium]